MTMDSREGRLLLEDPVSYVLPRSLPNVVVLAIVIYAGINRIIPWPMAALLLLLITVVIAIRINLARQAHSRGWGYRIDQHGVTRHFDGHLVPWTSVVSIETRRSTLRSRLADRPVVLLVDAPAADFATRAHTRPTRFPIDTSHLKSTGTEVLEALQRERPGHMT